MKTILITGSTDGIGLLAAQQLAAAGHDVVVHGRSADKLVRARELVSAASPEGRTARGHLADLSRLAEVASLARAVGPIDVLINNAGVFHTPTPRTADGLDVRFVVNTLAPILLTRRLLPSMRPGGRVVNLSSAAQSPVNLDALQGKVALAPFGAYGQSKLAITAWTRIAAQEADDDGPVYLAVNPGSMLGTKMVQEGFGTPGRDVGIGADILVRAALDPSFAAHSGAFFDNDAGDFGPPHPAARDDARNRALMAVIDAMLPAHDA